MEEQGTEIPREKLLLWPEISPLEKHFAEPEDLGGFLIRPNKAQLHEAGMDWVLLSPA